MKPSNCANLILLLVLTLSTLTVVARSQDASDQEIATQGIKNAEEAAITAYKVTIQAENIGANITDLTSALNTAEYLLATARVAYNNGNFTEAAAFASQAKSIGDYVNSKASDLKASTHNENLTRQLLVSLGSVLGIAAIALASTLTWRSLRKHDRT